MRFFTCLPLLALLLPAIPAHADLSEADGMIGVSAREVGWVVWFPREWFTLLAEQIAHPEGHRAHEHRFTVLWDPEQVELEDIFAMRPTPVS